MDFNYSHNSLFLDAVKTSQPSRIVNLLSTDITVYEKRAALFISINNNDVEIVKILLQERQDFRIGGISDNHLSNLIGYHHLEEAVFMGYIEILRVLLDHGANIHLLTEVSSDSDDPTLLMLASQEGHLEVVKALVEAGADINITRQGNSNALQSAAGNGYLSIFQYLYPLVKSELQQSALEILPNGLKMREFEDNADPLVDALTTALVKCEFSQVQEILRNGVNVNGIDSCGGTPLFYAVIQQCSEIVQLLLQLEADPDVGDAQDGRTPLMCLSMRWDSDSTQICCSLIESGANVNAKDNQDQTALIHSVCPLVSREDARLTKEACILLLLECGADVNARDTNAQTALTLISQAIPHTEIEEQDKQAITKLLIKFGAVNSIEKSSIPS